MDKEGKVKKSILICMLVCLLTLWTLPGLCETHVELPREPIYRDQIVECSINYDLDILWFAYDLDGDGRIDYWAGRTLIETDNGLRAILQPMYYGVDFNRDGEFTKWEIFVDVWQDGVNGNEMLNFKYLLQFETEEE